MPIIASLPVHEVFPFWRLKQHPNQEEQKRVSWRPALVLLQQWDRLVEKNGVLYRHAEAVFRLLLPGTLKKDVLKQVHQGHGHHGVERTLELLQQRCYWPTMSSEVAHWCQACERCQVANDVFRQGVLWDICWLHGLMKFWPWTKPSRNLPRMEGKMSL